jgi:hypothetical protein
MTSKILRVVPMIFLASLALSSAAWATCANTDVTGAYGYVFTGTNRSGGDPTVTAAQITFDSATGTFSGTGTVSTNGVLTTGVSISGTYLVAANCTGTGTETIGTGKTQDIFFVTAPGAIRIVDGTTGTVSGGIAVPQGTATCTPAGIEGTFALDASGVYLKGAPARGPVNFVGALTFTVNGSGDGVISGSLAGSQDGKILTFANESVTGTYTIASDCTGTLTITPKGFAARNYNLIVVSSGLRIMLMETDADTVVSGNLQR